MENKETFTVVRLQEPSMNLILIQSFFDLKDAREKQTQLKNKNIISFIFKTV